MTICKQLSEALETKLDEVLDSKECNIKSVATASGCVIGGILIDSCAYLGATVIVLSVIGKICSLFPDPKD